MVILEKLTTTLSNRSLLENYWRLRYRYRHLSATSTFFEYQREILLNVSFGNGICLGGGTGVDFEAFCVLSCGGRRGVDGTVFLWRSLGFVGVGAGIYLRGLEEGKMFLGPGGKGF